MNTAETVNKIMAEVVPVPGEEPAQGQVTQHTQALMVRETGGAVGRALSLEDLKENLRFVKQVMQDVMTEDVDYGKVPGCGDKPGLFQPGAQKLLMTFQLTDHVIEERVVDFPNYHREYSFRIGVRAPNGKTWEGVGTCSTLEAKYRWRGGARKCPECGKPTIIKGKEQYGGGWLCWAKKGGCGKTWPDGAREIESQSEEKIENENPADCWNTARKMAFKRGLVHASINATNTSELWSQDLEDLADRGEDHTPPPRSQGKAGATNATSDRQSTAGSRQNASQGKPATATRTQQMPPPATEAENKTLFVNQLRGKLGSVELENRFLEFLEMTRNSKQEFFISPGQTLLDCDLADLKALVNHWDAAVNPKFIDWQMQMRAAGPTRAATFVAPAAGPATAPAAKPQVPAEQPRPASLDGAMKKDPEWFFDVIVPIPRKGMKKPEYMKKPDTIGSLWKGRHQSHDDMKRLMGFVSHYVPEGWTNNQGKHIPPSEADKAFRVALDAFADWHAKHGEDKEQTPGLWEGSKDERDPGARADAHAAAVARDAAAAAAGLAEEDDVPF